jgi:hypothetical protein
MFMNNWQLLEACISLHQQWQQYFPVFNQWCCYLALHVYIRGIRLFYLKCLTFLRDLADLSLPDPLDWPRRHCRPTSTDSFLPLSNYKPKKTFYSRHVVLSHFARNYICTKVFEDSLPYIVSGFHIVASVAPTSLSSSVHRVIGLYEVRKCGIGLPPVP